ncbi:hypothetical protein SAMN04488021_13110 [Paracoccus aminovorans]|uniref:HTH araC/xylS-type domain-containing protein n=1 Tax=Paracoccus aminovorans TaxID=34004 RepID=A0A1I3CI35_9RHOB|nr:hypothetical protein JCM7685_2579 [Paracoccus aminovorans]SFH73996.1 hypothetical protein SAMN04488021_13110 [Paracoccus aminovorans]
MRGKRIPDRPSVVVRAFRGAREGEPVRFSSPLSAIAGGHFAMAACDLVSGRALAPEGAASLFDNSVGWRRRPVPIPWTMRFAAACARGGRAAGDGDELQSRTDRGKPVEKAAAEARRGTSVPGRKDASLAESSPQSAPAGRCRDAQILGGFNRNGAAAGHVAEMAGFGSAVSLRQHFTRAFSISPASYRRQFRSKSELQGRQYEHSRYVSVGLPSD